MTDVAGSRGRHKKKLAINEAEAGIVRRAYDLYLHGLEGQQLGCKQIAQHLTEKGLLMRGKSWRMQKVQHLLSDTLYMGEYFTNIRDSKANTNRPPEEWIKTSIPAIMDAARIESTRLADRSRRSRIASSGSWKPLKRELLI